MIILVKLLDRSVENLVKLIFDVRFCLNKYSMNGRRRNINVLLVWCKMDILLV